MYSIKELKKLVANNCPRCGEEIKPFTLHPQLPFTKSYCPECDIVRMTMLTFPYLCKTCNSAHFTL